MNQTTTSPDIVDDDQLEVITDWWPDPDPESAESLCGADDFQDVDRYDGTLGPTKEFVRRYSGSTCRIKWNADLSAFTQQGNVAGANFGTGTLIAPNLVLTAAHLFEEPPRRAGRNSWVFPLDNQTNATISSAQAATSMHVQFNAQLDSSGRMRQTVDVPIVELIAIRPGGLDVALVRLATSPGPRFGWREIAERAPVVGEPLTIIQHPAGRPKKIEAGTAGRLFTNDLGYGDIDTLGGSSGSGVLDRLGRLVAVHVRGGCGHRDHRRNYGVRLDRVLAESAAIREAVSRVPRTAVAGGESCVVAYADDPDRNGYDNISLATIRSNGRIAASSSAWNTQGAGHQIRPRVAAANDMIAVTWEDDADENDFSNVLVAGADRKHRHRFLPKEAHGNGSGQQLAPDVGIAADGSSVVVWEDDNDQNGYYNIHARGLRADGSRKFGDVMVNAQGAGQQFAPRVSVARGGSFVVVWEDDRDHNGHLSIMARRFDAKGRARGGDIAVNTRLTAFQQLAPAVSLSPSGKVMCVAWEDDADNNGFYNVCVKVINASSGKTLLSERQAHRNGSGQQRRPATLARDDGSFVVAWEDDPDRNGLTNIVVRDFNADGSQRFALRPHEDVAGHQRNPTLARLDDGTIIVGIDEDRDLDGHYEPLVCAIDPRGRRQWNVRP